MSEIHNIKKELNEQELRRIEELELLEKEGINPYPYSFNKTHSCSNILENYQDEDNTSTYADVSIAGRIVAIRRMGKATFFHILDEGTKFQVYFKKDELDSTEIGLNYAHLRLLDIGDIIGIRGYVFRTKTGEVSLHSRSVELLCKSITTLPVVKEEIDEAGNKITHDSFADKELRYRKRYVDLIVNPNVRTTFIKRSKIITYLRNFFDKYN